MILKFREFLLEEYDTVNEPIPELKEPGKLGIILLGVPGAGKSTFAEEYIDKKIKKFSTDDVSLEFTGDPKKYYPKASQINLERLRNCIDMGEDFIYDTTGKSEESVIEIFRKSKKNDYRVIFVLVLIDKETAKMQNLRRGRIGGHMADEEYIEEVYKEQLKTTKNYLKLNPDGFYIALSKSFSTPIDVFPEIKYKFMKFDKNGVLMRRRKNRYEYR